MESRGFQARFAGEKKSLDAACFAAVVAMCRSVSTAVQFRRELEVVDLREDRGVWGVGRNRSSRSLKSATVLVAN